MTDITDMKDEEKTKRQLIAELKALRLQSEKIAQEADRLRSSEGRYRNFVENAADGCAEYDLNGRCTFCNRTTYELMGCTREEYMRRRHRDRFRTKEEGDSVIRAFKRIYDTGKTANLIFDLISRNGSLKTVEASVSLIRDAAGRAAGFRSIARDLTERRRMEAERERYRNFVDNLSDGCYEFDLDGKITFCNEGLPRILAIPGTNFFSLTVSSVTSARTMENPFFASTSICIKTTFRQKFWNIKYCAKTARFAILKHPCR